MYCVSPIQLKDTGKSYKRPALVPCGKCVPCLERKRNDWSIRIQQQLKESESAVFLTLTYNPESIPFDSETGCETLDKKDLQNYMKSLRHYLNRGVTERNFLGTKTTTPKIKVKLVYFAQGEYGSKKDRPHYHMILFNFPVRYQYLCERAWQKGFVHFGEVNQATIHYCTKYMITKHDPEYDGREKPFALMSKGIGQRYVEKFKEYHTTNMISTYTDIGGVKYPLPRYMKEKIFNDHDKIRISSKNMSYSQRAQIVQDNKIRSGVKSDHEFYAVKHSRLKDHLEKREKFLNKKNRL